MNLNTEICKSFNAKAHGYEQAAKVQREIGERLFERLGYLKMQPQYVLDLGCGPGQFSQRLKKRYPKATIVGIDLAKQMLEMAQKKQGILHKWPLVQCHMANLPFASGTFDLIFANQVVHWASSLPLLWRELNRVMRQDGCLMFSTLGPDTFVELRQLNSHAHVNAFADMHDIGDDLLSEQFLDPVVDMERLTAHFDSATSLFSSLKEQGVKNINPLRHGGLTGKSYWKKFIQSIESLQTPQGKIPLTYEVIYGQAWKGANRCIDSGTETFISVSQLRESFSKIKLGL